MAWTSTASLAGRRCSGTYLDHGGEQVDGGGHDGGLADEHAGGRHAQQDEHRGHDELRGVLHRPPQGSAAREHQRLYLDRFVPVLERLFCAKWRRGQWSVRLRVLDTVYLRLQCDYAATWCGCKSLQLLIRMTFLYSRPCIAARRRPACLWIREAPARRQHGVSGVCVRGVRTPLTWWRCSRRPRSADK